MLRISYCLRGEVIVVSRLQRTIRADDPVDAALRTPHPATLIGGSLGFVSFLAVLIVQQELRTSGALSGEFRAKTVIALSVCIVTALTALLMLLVRRARTIGMTLVGLLLFDISAPLLQIGAFDPASARARAVFLLIPTVIAASSLGARYFRGQVLIAIALATLMLTFAPDDRGAFAHGIEAMLAVGVLLTAAIMVRRVSDTTRRYIGELRSLALTDKLTGILNRRGLADGFSKLIRAALSRSARKDAPIGVLSIDVDHFKRFNDEYGHAAGDDVLRRVCRVLQASVGFGNLSARTGGEELAAIVVGDAETIANDFRQRLAQLDQPHVTVSVGILDVTTADCTKPDDLWRILDAADQAMYQAKTTGRDQVCRGSLDRVKEVKPPLAPAPKTAAVPPRAVETAASSSSLPGWMLVIFALVGIGLGFVHETTVDAGGVDPVHLTIMFCCLILGTILIGVTPRADRFRWVAGVAGTDLVVAVSMAGMGNMSARIIALFPLVLTGLMVAQHFSRVSLLAHHGVVLGLSLLAPLSDPSAPMFAIAILDAAIMIGSTELVYNLQQRSHAATIDLHRWTVTDPLTGLANRHGLELGFDSLSHAKQLTVLALDVDDFKGVNDTYGHAAGDDALIRLAATLRTVTTPDTVVCRTGGDEFVVVAPSMRPSALTSRVKRAAELLPLPLSVSIGCAVASPDRLRSLWQLVDAADASLMRAKRSSRAQRLTGQPEAAHRLAGSDLGGLTAILDASTAHLSASAAHPDASTADYDIAAELSELVIDELVTDSDDGSSSDTSTRTMSPSVILPASKSRAS